MRSRKNILYFLLVACVIALLMNQRRSPINWLETYSEDDKIPFGCYVVTDLLKGYMGNHEIETISEPYLNVQTQLEFSRNSNLILISKQLEFSLSDLEILNEFMEQGNTVFVSAEGFNTRFTKEYDLSLNSSFNWTSDTTAKQVFVNEKLLSDTLPIYNRLMNLSFDLDTSFKGRCLAVDSKTGNPNYIRIKKGKGQLLVHLNPKVFSNFNILKDQKAASYALSYLPKQDCLWDEYHKSYHLESQDQMTYIRSNQTLRYAFNLGIIAILLFALFRSKRMQRVIPVIKQPKNDSLDFIETIGRLYYDEHKNYDLAQKKITHFYRFVREKYAINQQREDFWNALQAKTGIDKIELSKLQEMLVAFPKLTGISDAFLLRLNNHIDHFYERTGKQHFYE